MCSRGTLDPMYSNAYYVSYNTPYLDVYDDLANLKNISFDTVISELFCFYRTKHLFFTVKRLIYGRFF